MLSDVRKPEAESCSILMKAQQMNPKQSHRNCKRYLIMICNEKRQQVQQILQLLQLTREVGKLKGTAKTVQHAMRY